MNDPHSAAAQFFEQDISVAQHRTVATPHEGYVVGSGTIDWNGRIGGW